MNNLMQKWERKTGVQFLKKIGLRPGQTILDFGAGIGHYSIPAALAVGPTGLVYALEKEHKELEELELKANRLNLTNINIVNTKGDVIFDLDEKSIYIILIYDVLHYFNTIRRKAIYKEAYRVLKPQGILSVYPKHTIKDYPLDQFRNMYLDNVINEIKDSGFKMKEKYCDMISHDDSLVPGCIFNLKKAK